MMNVPARVATDKTETTAAIGPRIADGAAQLLALRTIVDDLDYGIVVLDRDRRVQFVNRAFRRFWRIPDEAAAGEPSFIKLMYHGRGASAYAVSHDRLGDYVAKQLDLIRSAGKPTRSSGWRRSTP
jgi:PAS domain-containing protein